MNLYLRLMGENIINSKGKYKKEKEKKKVKRKTKAKESWKGLNYGFQAYLFIPVYRYEHQAGKIAKNTGISEKYLKPFIPVLTVSNILNRWKP